MTEKQIPTHGMFQQWQHLHEIAKPILEFQQDLEIGLLIGSNCPAALEPLEVIPSGSSVVGISSNISVSSVVGICSVVGVF